MKFIIFSKKIYKKKKLRVYAYTQLRRTGAAATKSSTKPTKRMKKK